MLATNLSAMSRLYKLELTMNLKSFHTKMAMVTGNHKMNNMIEKMIDKNVDKSFVVCDLNDIVQKYENWKLTFPRIKPFYAVKCNNYPSILELLVDLGIGFDCANKFEIESLMKKKCSVDNIIFANTIKDVSHMNYANSVGVTMTTFDSLSELEKCKKYYPRAKLLMRIKTYSTNLCNFDEKFGCDAYQEAPLLLEAAKRLNLDVVGVSFHVGTSCRDGTLFRTAIKLSRYVFDVASQLGFNLDIVDIGGGFVGYSDRSIFEIGKHVNSALDTYFPDENIRVIAEPGRYFVASSMTLATKVICARPNLINCNQNELRYLYYVDNGIFNMFSTVIVGVPAPSPLAWKKFQTTPVYPSTVFGQSMAPYDIISPHVNLPKLEIGDWLIYENMGAYTQCLETHFHMFEYTPVYSISRFNNRIENEIQEE